MSIDELEQAANRYAQLKRNRSDSSTSSGTSNGKEGLAELAAKIIDSISSPSFAFTLKQETLASNGTTTYVYKDNATYPALFDFLSETLHSQVPIQIRDAKFGPGEIIVGRQDKAEADAELGLCVKELQKLVHAKRAEMMAKQTTAAATGQPSP